MTLEYSTPWDLRPVPSYRGGGEGVWLGDTVHTPVYKVVGLGITRPRHLIKYDELLPLHNLLLLSVVATQHCEAVRHAAHPGI